MKPRRRLKPRPTLDLRRQSQRATIARLLLLGWNAERIARRMGVTARMIRYHISTPEFEVLYAKLQREHLSRVDRQLSALLNGAVDALERMLKHHDWRARDSAIEKILRVHGKYVEKFDITGSLDHSGQVRHVHAELVEGPLTDEMREKARELLRLQRGMLQRQLPARLTDPDRDGVNGRFLPNGQRDDEEKTR